MPIDVIVLANPNAQFSQGDTYSLPQGGSPAGPGVVMAQLAANDMAQKNNVQVDPDASSNEVVVVANEIKEDLIKVAVAAAANSGGRWGPGFNVPCIGITKYAEYLEMRKI